MVLLLGLEAAAVAAMLGRAAFATTGLMAAHRGPGTAVENRANGECAICLEAVGSSQDAAVGDCCTATTSCGHLFCRSCLVRHIQVRWENGDSADCPLCRCRLSEPECASVGASRPLPLAPRPIQRADRTPSSLDTLFAFIRPTEASRLAGLNLRHCPACTAIIQKNGGCSHMRCRCGHTFRWDQARPVDFSSDVDRRQGSVRWPTLAQDAGRLPTLSTRIQRHGRNANGGNVGMLGQAAISTVGGGIAGGLVGGALPLVPVVFIGCAANRVGGGLAGVVGCAWGIWMLVSSPIWIPVVFIGAGSGAALGLVFALAR